MLLPHTLGSGPVVESPPSLDEAGPVVTACVVPLSLSAPSLVGPPPELESTELAVVVVAAVVVAVSVCVAVPSAGVTSSVGQAASNKRGVLAHARSRRFQAKVLMPGDCNVIGHTWAIGP
jgi:hypothetical protein